MLTTIIISLISTIILIISLIAIIANCVSKPKITKPKQSGYVAIDTSDKYQQRVKTFSDVCERIKELYTRPIERTSVGIDIPRLASKMRVYDKNNELVLNGIEIGNKNEHHRYGHELTLKEVATVLIRLLDGDEMATQFEQSFDETFTYIQSETNGDCGTFFQKMIQKLYQQETLSLKVMKTFTQALFAAAVEYMLPFRMKHGYHDGHTGWKIDVNIDDNYIIVKHTKGETSYGEPKFTFEWNLIYTIERSSEDICDMKLVVDNVEFLNYPMDLQQDFYTFVDSINAEAHI